MMAPAATKAPKNKPADDPAKAAEKLLSDARADAEKVLADAREAAAKVKAEAESAAESARADAEKVLADAREAAASLLDGASAEAGAVSSGETAEYRVVNVGTTYEAPGEKNSRHLALKGAVISLDAEEAERLRDLEAIVGVDEPDPVAPGLPEGENPVGGKPLESNEEHAEKVKAAKAAQ